MGLALGLVMPVVAIMGPIGRALSKTLRDALDIYHARYPLYRIDYTLPHAFSFNKLEVSKTIALAA